jgi:hypothetical protein
MKIYNISFILLFSCSIPLQEFSNDNILNTGQTFTRQFYSYELDSLHKSIFDKNFTLKNLKDFRAEVDQEFGDELKIYQEKTNHVVREGKMYYGYRRQSKFSKTDRPVLTLFGFDDNKTIYRFEVITLPKEAPLKYDDYLIKTQIRLPFEGKWFVAAGGRSIMNNHHAISVDQRYAYDFLIKKNGTSFTNTGLRNEDYYCFNKKIFAPGSGIVVDLVNNIKENKVGDMPPISGNRIIIDHKNGEYSVLAHFKEGSIVVNLGDTVISGQYLGLCGNSGHSSEPHLHYHMQNSPVMFEGEGLPIQFVSYYSNGIYINEGEPEYGEIIRRK